MSLTFKAKGEFNFPLVLFLFSVDCNRLLAAATESAAISVADDRSLLLNLNSDSGCRLLWAES